VDQSFTTTLRLTDSLNSAPSLIRKAIGSEIDWIETQNWPKSLDAEGCAAGKITVDVEGKPAKMSALASLIPTSAGSEIVFIGELKVGIPLVGSQIEKFVVGLIEDAFGEIEDGMNEWLEGERNV
jgi:hypothetical protein